MVTITLSAIARTGIKPQVEGIGFLEFHQLDAAREAGRAAVEAALSSASGASLGKAPVST